MPDDNGLMSDIQENYATGTKRTPMSTVDIVIPDVSRISLNPNSTLEDRRAFNAESLVARLDDDVLVNVFIHNTIIDFSCPHSPSQTVRRTSQVCHAWRECTLGYPVLWGASIDFGDPIRWIEECITRSGSSVLYDIILPSLTPHLMSNEYGNFLRTSAQRPRQSIPELIFLLSASNIPVQNLQLGMSVACRARNAYIKIRKTNWSYVNDSLVRPAPNLRFFSLCIQGSQQTDEVYDLTEDLFAGEAPNLRGLELRGCSCHFLSPIFRNLTTLVVRKPSSRNIPSLTAWLGILAKMKSLQVLDLNQCAATLTDADDLTKSPAVSLAHLESLTIAGFLPACSFLLTHLTIPDTCVVSVKCHRTRRDDQFRDMLAVVHARMERLPVVSERTGIVVHGSSTGFGFAKHYVAAPRLHEVIFSFTWYASSTGDGIVTIAEDVLPSLKLAAQGVPELRLDFNNSRGGNVAYAKPMLAIFESVEHLHMVMGYTVWCIIKALRIAGADDDQEGIDTQDADPNVRDENILLPQLKSILLEHVLFNADGGLTATSPKPDDLIQFIFGRPRIDKVTFINCEPVEYITEELKLFGVSCTTILPLNRPVHP